MKYKKVGNIKTRLMTNKERNSFTLLVIDALGEYKQFHFNTEAEALDFQRRMIDRISE